LGSGRGRTEAAVSPATRFDLVCCDKLSETLREVEAARSGGRPFGLVLIDSAALNDTQASAPLSGIHELDPDIYVVLVGGSRATDPLIDENRSGSVEQWYYLPPSLQPFETRGFIVALSRAWSAEQALHHSARRSKRLGRLLDESSNEFYMFDAVSLRFVEVNRGARENLGYTMQELSELGPLDLKPELDAKRFEELLRPLRTGRKEQVTFRTVHRRKDGSCYPIEARLQLSTSETPPVFVAIIQDISQRLAAEEETRFLARCDVLTGLANRNAYKERLETTLALARRHQRTVAILFLDLDDFKRVNDTLGHSVGDLLLQEIALRLSRAVRGSDALTRMQPTSDDGLVARLGGDEFTLLLNEIDRRDDAALVARRILRSVSEQLLLAGHEVHATTSIGIAVYPGDGEDAEALLRHADLAMYAAKQDGKASYRFYEASMDAAVQARLALEGELHDALDRGEFELYYQPQLDLATGTLFGAEALLRWHSPTRGMVSPADFIPVAEDTGLIVPIGTWVLREACAQLAAWKGRGLAISRIAVNVSVAQFLESGFPGLVARTLGETDLAPDALELEITESLLAKDVEGAVEILQALKKIGVELAIDDFGTGYSSLSQLKRFPIDRLKIDQSFVRNITSDLDDAAIAMSVIGMAKSMRLKVIAEGVEDQAQLLFLEQRGCDEIQGYYLSRPLPAHALERMIVKHSSQGTREARAVNASRIVLLVDDDRNFLAATRRALVHEKYTVYAEADIGEAFNLLACEPIGVVIADYEMPEMEGPEFLRRVARLHPRIVRVMLSGRSGSGTVISAVNEGEIFRFLEKPISLAMLRQTLRDAFARYESEATDPQAASVA